MTINYRVIIGLTIAAAAIFLTYKTFFESSDEYDSRYRYPFFITTRSNVQISEYECDLKFKSRNDLIKEKYSIPEFYINIDHLLWDRKMDIYHYSRKKYLEETDLINYLKYYLFGTDKKTEEEILKIYINNFNQSGLYYFESTWDACKISLIKNNKTKRFK